MLLLAAVAALIGLSAVGLAGFAVRIQRVEQAQVAADAAALAGTVGGEASASALARANGGVLVAFRAEGEVVEVVVVVGGARAIARATRAP